MSRPTSFLTITALIFSAANAFPQSQVAYRAKVDDVKVMTQKSPDFEVGSGIKDIKTDRRDWFQIDVEFAIESTDSRNDFVGGVEVRFYALPKSAQKAYKKLYSASINHVDVLKDTAVHSAVFLSPNALSRIYGKGKTGNPRDLMVAIEIWAGGKMVGFKITDDEKSRWWRREDVPKDTTMLRPKHKTPFASLWYDSYAEVRD